VQELKVVFFWVLVINLFFIIFYFFYLFVFLSSFFMVSFNTHVSEAYVIIGLITVLYNFNFDCLVTNLLLKNFGFAYYAFVPRAILSLISSSIELHLQWTPSIYIVELEWYITFF